MLAGESAPESGALHFTNSVDIMKILHWPAAAAACMLLAACSSDPATFTSYTQRVRANSGRFDATRDPRPTDALAFNYANSVEEIFRARATGARYTREASDTALAGLSAFSGAAESLEISTSALSAMGLAGVGVLELRKIFDAKGRSTAYLEASERIHSSIAEFRSHNLNNVSEALISPNGWTLANAVQANIDIVSKILNGHLPTPEVLAQATATMTDRGAIPQSAGTTPVNNVVPAVRYPLPAHLRAVTVDRTPPRAPKPTSNSNRTTHQQPQVVSKTPGKAPPDSNSGLPERDHAVSETVTTTPERAPQPSTTSNPKNN